MFRLLQTRAGHYLLLLAVWAILTLPNLGAATLWDIDEGNNAEAAREMLAADNWRVPTFNFTLRTDKPALLYWLQIAGYELFGINEFSARLPSALAALLALFATYELGRRMVSPVAGLLAGLILACAPAFCAAAHFANPDALLTAFTTLAMLFFWRSYTAGGRGWFVPAGICTGLAVLAKGPVGLLLPAASTLLFLFWSRRLNQLWDRRLAWGALAHALVIAPWYTAVGIETKGEFLRGFVLTHNLSRFGATMENHHGFPGYYGAILLVGFLPWSAFLAPALMAAWKTFPAEKADGAPPRVFATRLFQVPSLTPAVRFLVCWIAIYLVFFSLSRTKLPNYILPLYPPVAILIARFLDGWRRGWITPPAWATRLGLSGFALIGFVIGAGMLIASGRLGAAALLRGRHFSGLENWAWVSLFPVAGALLAAAWVRRQRITPAIIALVTMAILFVATLAAGSIPVINNYKAPSSLAACIQPTPDESDIRVACYDYFQPSLVFYCGRQVDRLQSEEEAIGYLYWPLPVYLLMPAATWDKIEAQVPTPHRLLGRHYDLYRNCIVVVVTNR